MSLESGHDDVGVIDKQMEVAVSSEERSEQEPRHCVIYKICKTGVLVLFWVCLGFCILAVGPTLIDLKDRAGQNFEEISRSMAMRSVGGMVGSPLAGIIISKCFHHVDLILAISLAVVSASTLGIPWLVDPFGLSAMFFLGGVVEPFLNAGANSLVCALWGKRSSAPVQALHSGVGLGALLVPQIMKPFLGTLIPTYKGACEVSNYTWTNLSYATSTDEYAIADDESARISPTAVSNTTNDAFNCSVPSELINSRIEYGYLIVAIITFATALVMLGMYISGPPKEMVSYKYETSMLKVLHPASCGQGSTAFGVKMLFLLFLFYIHVIGGERAMGQFIYSYGVTGHLKMSSDQAANLNTANSAGFFAGRTSGILIALKLRPRYIVLLSVVGNLIATLVLSFVGYKEEVVLFICVVAFGYFESQVFAAGVAWANDYIIMYPSVLCVVMLSAYSGGFFYQWLTGYLFEYYGPRSMFFVLVGYVVCLGLSFVPMEIVARQQGAREIVLTKQHKLEIEVKGETLETEMEALNVERDGLN